MAIADSLRDGAARLATLVATPLVPADFLELISPLAAAAGLRGRIVAIQPETADSATIVIKPGRSWAGHRAGQYVRIGVDVDGVRLWRSYSMTAPAGHVQGCITITVKAIEDGVVSNYLVRRAKPGIVIQLDQAQGDFTMPTTPPAKVLFITAGSGITPVMGMLRDSATPLADAVIVHSSPDADSAIFGAELRAMAAAGKVTLIELHTDRDGMLDIAKIGDIVSDFQDRETWACGPGPMLDAIVEHFGSLGLLDNLHVERFRPAIVVSGEGGTVTYSRNNTVVEADGSTPLLDVGEAAGVLMPSGCRAGICFGCVVPLREGAVRDLRTGEVTIAAVGDGVLIQTCISAAAGACDIDV